MDDPMFAIFRVGFGLGAYVLFSVGDKVVRAAWSWNHLVGLAIGAAVLYAAGIGVEYMVRGFINKKEEDE